MNSSIKKLVTNTAPHVQRGLRTSSAFQQDSQGGFFNNFFDKKIEHQNTPHSSKFSSKETIMEHQTHNVKPDSLDKYLKAHKNLVDFINSNKGELHCEAIGNFHVFVGDEDQYVHIWKFDSGYAGIDKTLSALRKNPEFTKLRDDITPLLRNRHNQYLLPFSFWPEQYARKNGHIYELRSYHLKPGTMVEWGNYWARAIRMRDYQDQEAFVGMFSQVGELYNVKHIWCYDSLEGRKEARENVWQKQQSGWSEIVANTVPLIREMTSRIMVPLDHSPTQ